MRYLHTMIRVADPARTVAFFELLGLEEARRIDNEAGRFTLIFLATPADHAELGDQRRAEVELTHNWDPEEYDEGRNFGHLAYRVEDIYATCQRLMDAGVTINRPPRDGYMAFVRSPDAISIELLQEGGPKQPGRTLGIDAEHRQMVTARADLWRRVGARVPVIQAPMAGAGGVELAAAVIAGGGVGSLPGALVAPGELVAQAAAVRARAEGPLLLNFFCHAEPPAGDDAGWLALLRPFYDAEGLEPVEAASAGRRPFDAEAADAVEAVRPAIVSFHFGLPDPALVERVRAAGALVLASATTVAEAEWLAARGCDAIIAQGYEAGGHAGWFLDGHRPVGMVALVPQVVDAVGLPVIAAGGIGDARGVRAALALGAGGVQVGTAYLACRESLAPQATRERLGGPEARDTVFTNVLTGRAARGFANRLVDAVGPMSPAAPPFPRAAAAIAPLRAHAEREGRADYSSLWAGQAAPLARASDAKTLTEKLGAAALAAMETC